MTISSTTNRVSYTGNGVTTSFAFGNKFLTDADLVVYVDGVLQTIVTDYTVSGAGDDAGGTVDFLTAPADTTSIVIVRDPARTQTLDLVENDSLPAESVEEALDKLTILVQRLGDLTDRSFVLADTDTSNPSLVIPTPEGGKIISWNTGGTALEYKDIGDIGAISLPVPVAQGGTNGTDAATARTNLGLVIGTDVQAYDAATAKTDVAQTFSKTQTWTKGADVASGSSLAITDGNYFDVTGTTAITAIASKGVGTVIKLHFDDALTLTHHATNLILPGGADITTAAGDEFEFTEYTNGGWRCTGYALANGGAISGGGQVKARVNFNGTGTVAIRAAYNVSSITDNGTGDYTVNFTTPMVDADYSAVVSVQPNIGTNNPPSVCLYTNNPSSYTSSPPTASSFRFMLVQGATSFDSAYCNVVVLR